jgi:hypothetical protein
VPEPIEDVPRSRYFRKAVLDEFEARGGGPIHLRDDLVWGKDFYEGVFDRLKLTPAQLAILDGAGRSKAEHMVRGALDSLSKKGTVVHIRHNVWMCLKEDQLPKEDRSPESSAGLGWIPRRRPINTVRDRLCWVRP